LASEVYLHKINVDVRFEVLAAVSTKMAFFYNPEDSHLDVVVDYVYM
jgi:hypothetical protein